MENMCCKTLFESINKHDDDTKCLEYLLRKKRYSPNIANKHKHSPLYIAISLGYINSVMLLLNHGAFVNDPLEKILNTDYNDYFIIAMKNRKIECIELLFEFGVITYKNDLVHCNKEVYPSIRKYISVANFNLDYFINNDNEEMVKALLNDKIKVSPSVFRKALKNLKYLQIFVDYGVNFNEFSSIKNIPLLHLAINKNKKERAKILLSSNIDINQLDYYDRTALHYAVVQKDKEYMYMLIDHNINQSIIDKNDRTAYKLADNATKKLIDDYNSLMIKEPSEN